MARLRDVIPTFRSVGLWTFFKRVWQQVNEDNILTWASAMAYSWLFAIFPFLIVLMSLIARLPRSIRESTQQLIHGLVNFALPGAARTTVMYNIDAIMSKPRHGALLGLGILITLISASGGISTTMSALDRCYDVRRTRPIWQFRAIAFILTVMMAALVLLVIILVPLGTLLTDYLLNRQLITPKAATTLIFLRYATALILMVTLVATIYYFGPSIRQKFRILSPGALFTILVWIILGDAFRYYVEHFGRYDQQYGTVGGVAVLMVIFYLDSVVLLVGAEINSEIDFTVLGVTPGSKNFMGKAKGQNEMAD